MPIPVRPRGRSSWSIGMAVRDSDLAGDDGSLPGEAGGTSRRGVPGRSGERWCCSRRYPGLLPRSAVPLAPPSRRALWRRGEPPGHVAARGGRPVHRERSPGALPRWSTRPVAPDVGMLARRCPRPRGTSGDGALDGRDAVPGLRARHLDGSLPGTPLGRRPRTGRTAPHWVTTARTFRTSWCGTPGWSPPAAQH